MLFYGQWVHYSSIAPNNGSEKLREACVPLSTAAKRRQGPERPPADGGHRTAVSRATAAAPAVLSEVPRAPGAAPCDSAHVTRPHRRVREADGTRSRVRGPGSRARRAGGHCSPAAASAVPASWSKVPGSEKCRFRPSRLGAFLCRGRRFGRTPASPTVSARTADAEPLCGGRAPCPEAARPPPAARPAGKFFLSQSGPQK